MQLQYTNLGEGESIVLLHGLFGNRNNLNTLAKYLAKSFNVINVDLRNHGESAHSQSHDYLSMAQDVVETIQQTSIEKYHVLGHSMGGKVAMQIALNFPHHVNKLIVEDIAPASYPDRHSAVFEALQALDLEHLKDRKQALSELNAHLNDINTCHFLLKNLKNDGQKWYWQMNLTTLKNCYTTICGFPGKETAFHNPSLFIKGANSDYLQAQHSRLIAQYFPAFTAKIIEGAGHWIHSEKSAVFNKIVLDFLQK
ncbi:alpha/beta fold hydrolase [Catenovulum sediminis]|uniref:alpha/beta fold hydrolase n=1 Tax=Catenovulum sediminis TaxID=1740262 RepID=UPI00117D8216|nr:alpha/beta fold hydrolase [Catenovulum sediminis]